LLVYWEHSYSLSVPWPGYFTREIAIEHNQQQWQMVADWPLPKMMRPAGRPVKLPAVDAGGPFQPNGLCLAGSTSVTWRDFKPLPKEVVISSTAERIEGGAIRCRHRIDRRKLPDPAEVIWAWKLTDAEATAPVVIQTASGTTRWPDDGLGGYAPFHFVAPRGFRIGPTRFVPQGPFAFARPPEHPGWLLAYVLSQGRSATFKGGQKGQLTFDEVYQGEESIHDFAIEIHPR
jgi:hypothetical protein